MRGLAGPPGSSSGEEGEDDEEASSSEEGSGEAGAAADEVRLDLMSGSTADGLRDAGLGIWYASHVAEQPYCSCTVRIWPC